jgi:hypothetical protein
MVKVKNLNQTRAGGLHVSMEASGKVSREEAYFTFELTWLGKQRKVDVTADRYRASHWDGDKNEDRLTSWRVIVRSSYDSVLTETARRAASDLIEPIVLGWIGSPEYIIARQHAYAYAIARAISTERYDADHARRVFEMHRHELNAADAARLDKACDLLVQLLDALREPVSVDEAVQ